MYSKKLQLLLILLALIITGCSILSQKDLSQNQGIIGRVMLKPDYDHSDMSYMNNPPDLTPRPIYNATVYLLEYHENSLNSKYIIEQVTTDSTGNFKITVPPGSYNLAVFGNVSSVVHFYTPNDTTGFDFMINEYITIEIPVGEFINHEFMIFEMVPQ